MAKVQQITGYKTEAMTEKYTHFYSEEFVEVRNLQDQLLLPDGQGGPQTNAETNAKQRELNSRGRRRQLRRVMRIILDGHWPSGAGPRQRHEPGT